MVTSVAPSLVLEIGQAFSSMLELDPVLLSTLKQMQGVVNCEGVSIWLLNEAETDILCTHANGQHWAKMLGNVMRARKFFAAYRPGTSKLPKIDNSLQSNQSKWMDAKAYRTQFQHRRPQHDRHPTRGPRKIAGRDQRHQQDRGTRFHQR